MIIKGKDSKNEINGYPIIIEYKYLGIIITNKIQINKHIDNINKKVNIYFQRNNILNKRYFSIKSIMLLFEYYHKSRFLYGLFAFIEQKSKINRIDNTMLKNIKKLLKLPIITNNKKLNISLGLPDLNLYLTKRLIKLKKKYEKVLGEKLIIYDNMIKINTGKDNIPKIEEMEQIIENRFKDNAAELGIIIGKNYKYRLKHKIYNWYVDNDFLLLKFICDRGSFGNDMNKNCVLCKIAENEKDHIVNECTKLIKK